MLKTDRIRLVVEGEDAVVLDVVLDGPSALIGSGSHCDAQLGPEFCAPEQLLLELTDGGVFAENLAPEFPMFANGSPFRSGDILPDTVLNIGELALRVELEVHQEADPHTAEKTFQKGAVIAVVAVICLGIAGYFQLHGSKNAEEKLEPPDVFSHIPAGTCPESERLAANEAGEEAEQHAEVLHERAPFQVEAGLGAVEQLRQAAACYKVAGHSEHARSLIDESKGIEEDVKRDFHLHQVRLYRALALGKTDEIRIEADTLARYLARHDGPYVKFIDNLRRNLHAQSGGK